jgi:hypothetical protein
MSVRILLSLFVLLFLAGPILAEEDEPAAKEATAKELKHELKIFKKDFDTVDIDYKLDALIRLSKCIHKDVAKLLLTAALKDPDVFVRAEAVKGLGNQTLYPGMIGRKLAPLIEKDDLDPKILTETLITLRRLDYRRPWEEIIDLMAHDDDDVVVQVFRTIGAWKELRACLEMQGFWDAYPTEGSWSTGSVSVDTGTSGSGDQRAAKAKWHAKYGGRRKQRARPKCVKALKEAIQEMTGDPIEKPDEFRTWRSDHKMEIRAAKRRRN